MFANSPMFGTDSWMTPSLPTPVPTPFPNVAEPAELLFGMGGGGVGGFDPLSWLSMLGGGESEPTPSTAPAQSSPPFVPFLPHPTPFSTGIRGGGSSSMNAPPGTQTVPSQVKVIVGA